jgi:exodeoxyribonuclease III
MKIITWNCNMAFRKKAGLLMPYKPDILVIPECEHPDKLVFDKDIPLSTSCLWFGENKNKGLGVFSYSGYKLKTLAEYTDQYKIIAPIAVKSPALNLTLFAVWANNPNDPDGQYVTQVWKAINHYKKLLGKRKLLLAGDFNSNTIWDKPRRDGNHSTVVEVLQKKRISSVYHHHFAQVQGKELHPTYYLYRHSDKPYHLDYCFASKQMMAQLKSVEVGEFEYWKKYSDHVPVITTFG